MLSNWINTRALLMKSDWGTLTLVGFTRRLLTMFGGDAPSTVSWGRSVLEYRTVVWRMECGQSIWHDTRRFLYEECLNRSCSGCTEVFVYRRKNCTSAYQAECGLFVKVWHSAASCWTTDTGVAVGVPLWQRVYARAKWIVVNVSQSNISIKEHGNR